MCKQPLCVPIDKKDVTCTQMMGYCSAVKNNKALPFGSTWMNVESIILDEMSQSEREYCMISVIWRGGSKENVWYYLGCVPMETGQAEVGALWLGHSEVDATVHIPIFRKSSAAGLRARWLKGVWPKLVCDSPCECSSMSTTQPFLWLLREPQYSRPLCFPLWVCSFTTCLP